MRHDFALGIRLALSGGRAGWTRTLLTALGVGLGVAVLLLAAAVPTVLDARGQRLDARNDMAHAAVLPAAANTLLAARVDTSWQGRDIRGRILRPEGPAAPRPPGLPGFPADGTAYVSPALRSALDDPGGAELRRLIGYRVAGTIADAGLAGPAEWAYYAGDDDLALRSGAPVERLTGFGAGAVPPGDVVLTLILAFGLVTLLVPVAVFAGAAVRFGGEARDRRLAALRLAGADSRAVVRIAAGEALVGAVLGLAVGAVLFAIGRLLVPRMEVLGISAFAADVRPVPALVAVILAGVPGTAVLATLLALRGVVIEPLGVVRRAATRRRRFWWRLLLPAAGLLMLTPLLNDDPTRRGASAGTVTQLIGGVILLLTGLLPLLPWLVGAAAGRLRGGPPSWQLAIRRLQLHPAAATRAVSGIAVGVAGAIALQMVLVSADAVYLERTGQDPGRARYVAVLAAGPGTPAPAAVDARYEQVPGVRADTLAFHVVQAGPQRVTGFVVGDCADLRLLARLDHCADGDVFRTRDALPPGVAVTFVDFGAGGEFQPHGTWTIPESRPVSAVADPIGAEFAGLLVTPAAVPRTDLGTPELRTFLLTPPGDGAAGDRIRVAARGLDPLAEVAEQQIVRIRDRYGALRTGLMIGAIVVLLLLSLSLLLEVADRLRESRRVLGVLVAVGVSRAVLTRSVVWQTLVPVLLGVAVASAAGIGLGTLLQLVTDLPRRTDPGALLALAGAAVLVSLLTTALSLPGLRRLMTSQELRYE